MVRILEETAFVSPDLGVNKSNNTDWKSLRDKDTHTQPHTHTHTATHTTTHTQPRRHTLDRQTDAQTLPFLQTRKQRESLSVFSRLLVMRR